MSENTIEGNREHWAKIAKANGWYKEPFYVQVWINEEGKILDSVSFGGMTKDIIVREVRTVCDSCDGLHYEDDSCVFEGESEC